MSVAHLDVLGQDQTGLGCSGVAQGVGVGGQAAPECAVKFLSSLQIPGCLKAVCG